jgi:hypothetical protein
MGPRDVQRLATRGLVVSQQPEEPKELTKVATETAYLGIVLAHVDISVGE